MSDLQIWLILIGWFSIPFIFGAIVLPGKSKEKEKVSAATEPAPDEPTEWPKIYLPPPRQSRRQAYRGAGAAVTGAALMGGWSSDFNKSLFAEDEIGIGSDESSFLGHDFMESNDFIPSDGFIDTIHGGIDPTGQGGMAGDFNPDHIGESFSFSDPFDSGFISNDDFGSISFDSFGTDSIGSCDSFGTDSIGCGIGFDD
ncbi:hypothetical protein [Geomonas agri]|uniref:hypothetical protein n=1 Tax=Geomonas agri TaxID=2873702 RepID=UPI001CD324F9|nr:hypothetical protein [Geomonas agri]